LKESEDMKKLIYMLLFSCLFILVGCKTEPEIELITITFVTNGGNELEPMETYVDYPTNLPAPSRAGYNFDGWFDDEGEESSQNDRFSSNITLYAQWSIMTYKVRFIDYDGTYLSEETVKYNHPANGTTPPTRENYTFTGWDKSFDAITYSITIRATYEEATKGLVYELIDEGYMITDYTGTSKNVIVPGTYKGVKVTVIGASAFESSQINNISLSNNITEIREKAFYDCGSLENLVIPNSVAIIGDSAFENCVSLTSLIIPAKTIGDAAFKSNTNLKEVTLLDTVTSIGFQAFNNCADLISIRIPEGVTSIGNGAFSWCQNLLNIYTPIANVEKLQTLYDAARIEYAKKAKIVGLE
jgi:uncharacterized repeat protein (TIGR02543 family)